MTSATKKGPPDGSRPADVPATVLDSLLVGVQVISPDFRYLYVNEVVARHGHTTPEALLGRTMMECYPGIEQTAVFAEIQRCLDDRQPHSMRNAFTYPDGQEGWFELMLEPVPLGVTILSFDVTERHRAEARLRAALRRSELRTRCSDAVAHAADEAALTEEVCRVLVEVGGHAAARVVLSAGAVADGVAGRVEAGAWRPGAVHSLTLGVADLHLGELEVLPGEGHPLDAEERAVLDLVAATLGDGLGILRERARRERHAEQIAHAQRLETIGRLAGGVAHDFNNLLCVIQAHADFAAMSVPKDGPARQEIEHLCEAVERAERLTRELLAFGRRGVQDPSTTDINAVVEGITPMLRRLLGVQLELQTELLPDLGRVYVDQGQLEQVLLNLAVNARDAMGDGGRLRIETDNVHLAEESADGGGSIPAGDYVRISISDTGHGMSPQVRKRIFEPFFSTKGPGQGTGLGLASAYGIIKQSGGEIWVYSEPDVGTMFRIYLPRTDRALEPQQPPSAGPSAAQGGRVLLVDDDEMVRTVALRMLGAAGFDVHAAEDAEAALALAETLDPPPQLLLTDVVMPGMRGPELAATLVPRMPGLRVVFTSGYPALGGGTGVPEGARFVAKPFSAADLVRAVREVMAEDDEAAGD